jgi:hypothetical protein
MVYAVTARQTLIFRVRRKCVVTLNIQPRGTLEGARGAIRISGRLQRQRRAPHSQRLTLTRAAFVAAKRAKSIDHPESPLLNNQETDARA